MKTPDREFPASDAVRRAVPLWIDFFGPSGCGKTYTALEIATGVQQVFGGDIYGLDTEGNRMLAYADYFKFKHVPFAAPYGSLDYLAALQSIYKRGGRIIIGDSWSHEHEGVGGMIDFQESEVRRMAGDDFAKQERVKMLAWAKPKAARRQLLNGMVAMRDVTFIQCFRAGDVSKPVKGANGKAEVVHMGFVPIGGREFIFEATVALFLPPASRGVPLLVSENAGEKMMTKIPRPFDGLFKENEQLSRDHGRRMAEWARGGAASEQGTQRQPVGATQRKNREKTLTERASAYESALKGAKSAADLAKIRSDGTELLLDLHHEQPNREQELKDFAEKRFRELTKDDPL